MSERDYLKGVPLRLGKAFYPVARPQFKEIDIHIPIDALQEDYDFELERDVIESYHNYQSEKNRLRLEFEERQKRRAEDRVKAAEAAVVLAAENERLRLKAQESQRVEEEESRSKKELEFSAAVLENRARQSQSETKPLEPQPPPSFSSQATTQGQGSRSDGGIPVVVVPVSTSTKPPSSSPSSQKLTEWFTPSKVKLNLADFESDTANPFDSAEMNSINDKAELARIWANNLDFNRANISPSTTVPGNSKLDQTHMNGTTTTSGQPPTLNHHNPYANTTPNSSTNSYPTSWQPQHQHPQIWIPNSGQNVPYHPVTLASNSVPSTSASGVGQSPSTSAVTSHPQLASNVNSFTKIHFPFLTSYTQSSRERERAAERCYQQQLNSVSAGGRAGQLQQFQQGPGLPPPTLGGPSPTDNIPSHAGAPAPSANYGFVSVSWPVTPTPHHFPTNK